MTPDIEGRLREIEEYLRANPDNWVSHEDGVLLCEAVRKLQKEKTMLFTEKDLVSSGTAIIEKWRERVEKLQKENAALRAAGEKARGLLQEILDWTKYPETPWAVRAKEFVSALSKELEGGKV